MSGAFDPPGRENPATPPRPDPAAALPGDVPPGDPGNLDRRFRPKRKRGLLGSLFLYGGVLAVAFVLGVVFFNALIMPAFVHRGDEVRVPDLTGKDLTAAEALLAPRGLQLGEASRRNDARPAGTVVAQHPASSTSVKRGRLVSVVVSLGEAGIAIPSLLGETIQNAKLALEQEGLTPGDIVTAPCDSVSFNSVIATQPPAGAQATRGTPVSLLVSAGLGRPGLLMPDLSGRRAEDVLQTLIEAGFAATIRGSGNRSITRTEPPAGARVRYGSAIELHTD